MPSIDKRDFLKIASGSMLLLTGAVPAAAQSGSQFTASNFSGPSSATVGQTVTASVLVSNTGDQEGSTTVQYRIADEQIASRSVTLEANESRSVSLSGAVPSVSSGTQPQGIYFDDQTDPAAASTVYINPSAADFEVESIVTTKSEGRVGDSVSATATIRNRGESAGTERFQYRIRGSVVAERELQFNGGERRTVDFSGSVPNVPAGSTRQGVFVAGTNAGVDRSFTVLADGASFSVTAFSGPARADSGQTVSATATVRNTGGSSGTQTFRYRIGDERVANREVTLDAGASRSITLEGTVPNVSAGTYQQGVFVGNTNNGLTGSIRVDEGPGSRFSISRLQAPSAAEVGDEISIQARVTNNGTSRDESQIEYRIGGNRIDRQRVDIRAGQSTTVTFDVTVPNRNPTVYEQGVFVGTSTRGQTTSLRIRESTQFTLSNLETPSSARVDESISVQATVRNPSDSRVTRTVQYRIGDRQVAAKELTLRAGNRETVSFDVTVPSLATGSYRHGVYVDRNSLTAGLQVNARAEPEFSITNFSGQGEGTAGESVSAEATVENSGTASGSITVEYRINGRIVAAESVTIDADDSESVTFDGTVPNISSGDYTHGVFIANTSRGRTGTFTVIGDDTSDETTDEMDDETADEAPGFGVGAGVAGTAGAAYLYSKYSADTNEQSEQAD